MKQPHYIVRVGVVACSLLLVGSYVGWQAHAWQDEQQRRATMSGSKSQKVHLLNGELLTTDGSSAPASQSGDPLANPLAFPGPKSGMAFSANDFTPAPVESSGLFPPDSVSSGSFQDPFAPLAPATAPKVMLPGSKAIILAPPYSPVLDEGSDLFSPAGPKVSAPPAKKPND